jgi:uncharacterized protein YabN with tetrapyrrole methylase and pyrophosphatase domain
MSDVLKQALELQLEAAAAGFDWPDTAGVWDKLAEEVDELRAAADAGARTEELGDLLFMIANLSRHLGVDPIAALQAANAKFAQRFAYVMQEAATLPPLGDPRRLEVMEARWQRVKAIERGSGG